MSIFGLPSAYQRKDNAELLHLYRASAGHQSGYAFADTGPSNSDKYDAEDYDDDNFKTVSMIDGSHSPYVTAGSHPTVMVPLGLQVSKAAPVDGATHARAQPVAYSQQPAYTQPKNAPGHAPAEPRVRALPTSSTRHYDLPKKRTANSGMPEPPPPINPFINAMAGEGAAVRGAAARGLPHAATAALEVVIGVVW